MDEGTAQGFQLQSDKVGTNGKLCFLLQNGSITQNQPFCRCGRVIAVIFPFMNLNQRPCILAPIPNPKNTFASLLALSVNSQALCGLPSIPLPLPLHSFTSLLFPCFIIFSQQPKKMSKKGSWKRPWTEEEDQALKSLYQSTRLNKWSLIAEQLALDYGFSGRTGKQCRERYNNHLDPCLNRQDWSLQQEKKLFELHDQLGNKWAIISNRLGLGRTDNSVKNHFFSKLRKSLRRLNRIIQQTYKKEIREIQTKVLYKILEASEEKFKAEPMCEPETSQHGCRLKNKILWFSYEEEGEDIELSGEVKEQKEQEAKDLILQIINFNKNYKRKPKKFRRTSTQNYETLEVPKTRTVKRYNSNDSFSNSSNSNAESKSNFDSQESWEDDIDHRAETKPQQKKIISPIILRSKSQPELPAEAMVDQHQQKEKREPMRSGQQILDQLGLLQQLDAAIHPSQMKKQASMFSRRSSDAQDQQLKFFDDSEIEMRILFAHTPTNIKQQSYEDRLFHQ